jgi:hypothetical protein
MCSIRALKVEKWYLSRIVSSGMLCRVVLIRATRRNIPEDIIFHSHRRENLKSYIMVPFVRNQSISGVNYVV